MGELVAAEPGLDHQLGVEGGLEVVEDLVLAPGGHGGQQGELEAGADHRGRREQVLGRLGQHRQAAAHHLADPLGQVTLGQRLGAPAPVAALDGAGLDEVAEDLAGEKGVAAGLLGQGPHQPPGVVAELVARGEGDEFGHVALVEALQRDAQRVGAPVEVAEHGRQRMGPVEIGVAVGGDDAQAGHRVGGHQMAQEEERTGIGPVDVVEDQQGRLHRRPVGQPGAHRIEQADPLGVGGGGQGGRESGRRSPTSGTRRVSSSGISPRCSSPSGRPSWKRRASAKGW